MDCKFSSATSDDREGLFLFSTIVDHTAAFQCHSVAPDLCREWTAAHVIIPAIVFNFFLLLALACPKKIIIILPGTASVASMTNSACRLTLASVKPCPVSMILSLVGTGGDVTALERFVVEPVKGWACPTTGHGISFISFHRTLISYSPTQYNMLAELVMRTERSKILPTFDGV